MGRKIIKGFTAICAIIFLIAACLLDSEGWIPFWVMAITGAWLGLYVYLNNFFEDDREEVIKNEDHKAVC